MQPSDVTSPASHAAASPLVPCRDDQPPPSEPKTPISAVQPFGDYVARVFNARESNSSLYDLITCCATLYLFRCDPANLRRLTLLWAAQSAGKHESKMRCSILKIAGGHSPSTLAHEGGAGSDPLALSFNGVHTTVTNDERAAHLLSILQHCVTEYFNSNWHLIKRTININREYKEYILSEVLTRVLAMADAQEDFTLERRRSFTSIEVDGGTDFGASMSSAVVVAAPGSQLASAQETSPVTMAEANGVVGSSDSNGLMCSSAGHAAGYAPFLATGEEDESGIGHQSAAGVFKVPAGLLWVGEDSLQQLRVDSRRHGILLFFHALFSEPSATALHSLARAYAEHLRDPERRAEGIATLAVVNCASQVDLFRQYNVQWYPYIVYVPPLPEQISNADAVFVTADTDHHVVYPENGVRHGKFVIEWVRSRGAVTPQKRRIKDWVTRVVNLELRLRYKPFRDLQSSMIMLQRLQCVGDSCAQRMQHVIDDPPTFIFLGGGMAAGKTTAVMALSRSEWWQKHGSNTVVVNADEFKVRDPLYSGRGSDIHEVSTHYAEQLLVNAINQGRDIIFDGTMSWVPFVRQTVEMVRKAHLQTFRCGRGYKPQDGIEEYFLPVGDRERRLPQPYRIKMVAICVEPATAVPRGILRQLMTDRGVPVGAQLRSFKLFAEGFMQFVSMCDEVVLYNNNVWIDLEKGELPKIAAVKEDTEKPLEIVDQDAFEQFMNHTNININATGVRDLFINQSPPQSLSVLSDGSVPVSPVLEVRLRT